MAILPLCGCVKFKDRDQDGFIENLINCGSTLKIEENDQFYKITVGQMHWLTLKENLFNNTIFAMLILAALPANGNKYVATAKEVAKALGFKSERTLHYFTINIKKKVNYNKTKEKSKRIDH